MDQISFQKEIILLFIILCLFAQSKSGNILSSPRKFSSLSQDRINMTMSVIFANNLVNLFKKLKLNDNYKGDPQTHVRFQGFQQFLTIPEIFQAFDYPIVIKNRWCSGATSIAGFDLMYTDSRSFNRIDYNIVVAINLTILMQGLYDNYLCSYSYNNTAKFVFILYQSEVLLKDFEDFSRNVSKMFIQNFVLFSMNFNYSNWFIYHMHFLDDCFTKVHVRKKEFTPNIWIRYRTIAEIMIFKNYYNCPKIILHCDYIPYAYTHDNKTLLGLGGGFWDIILGRMSGQNITIEKWRGYNCEFIGRDGNDALDMIQQNYTPEKPVYLGCAVAQNLGSYYPWCVLDYLYEDNLVLGIYKNYDFDKSLGQFSLFGLLPGAFWCLHFSTWFTLSVLSWKIQNFQDVLQSKVSRGKEPKSRLFKAFLDFFSISIGMTTRISPSLFHLRILLVIWFANSFQFIAILSSEYTKSLTAPSHSKQISTIEEVVANGVKIYHNINETWKSGVIIDNKSVDNIMFFRKGHMNKTWINVLTPKTALLYRYYRLKANSKDWFIDENHINRLFIPNKNYFIHKYVSIALLVKHHIYKELLNMMIHHIHSAGLSNLILSRYNQEETSFYLPSAPALTFNDITSPGIIFFAGALLGFLGLCFELLCSTFKVIVKILTRVNLADGARRVFMYVDDKIQNKFKSKPSLAGGVSVTRHSRVIIEKYGNNPNFH